MMEYIESLGGTDAERAEALLGMPNNPGGVSASTVTQWRKRERPSWKWVAFLTAFTSEGAAA